MQPRGVRTRWPLTRSTWSPARSPAFSASDFAATSLTTTRAPLLLKFSTASEAPIDDPCRFFPSVNRTFTGALNGELAHRLRNTSKIGRAHV